MINPNPIIVGGFFDKILSAIGISLDFNVDNPVSCLMFGLGVIIGIVFILFFIAIFFKTLFSFFRGARL